jgi:hypothetical protein
MELGGLVLLQVMNCPGYSWERLRFGYVFGTC